MQINLTTNAAAMQAAFDKVRNPAGDINWQVVQISALKETDSKFRVLFGYQSGANFDLNVKATGDGGLEELVEEFEGSQMQYAITRVVDDNTKLPKLVFISWCGDGVPTTKKALITTHLTDVRKRFPGCHVEIAARSESDVEPSFIKKKVRDSTGANYSYEQKDLKLRKDIADVGPKAPVGTNYKRPEIIRATKPAFPPPAVGTRYDKPEIIPASKPIAPPKPNAESRYQRPEIIAASKNVANDVAPVGARYEKAEVIRPGKPLAPPQSNAESRYQRPEIIGSTRAQNEPIAPVGARYEKPEIIRASHNVDTSFEKVGTNYQRAEINVGTSRQEALKRLQEAPSAPIGARYEKPEIVRASHNVEPVPEKVGSTYQRPEVNVGTSRQEAMKRLQEAAVKQIESPSAVKLGVGVIPAARGPNPVAPPRAAAAEPPKPVPAARGDSSKPEPPKAAMEPPKAAMQPPKAFEPSKAAMEPPKRDPAKVVTETQITPPARTASGPPKTQPVFTAPAPRAEPPKPEPTRAEEAAKMTTQAASNVRNMWAQREATSQEQLAPPPKAASRENLPAQSGSFVKQMAAAAAPIKWQLDPTAPPPIRQPEASAAPPVQRQLDIAAVPPLQRQPEPAVPDHEPEPVAEPEPEPMGAPPAAIPGDTIQAIAIYEFTASEPNELTFAEGQLIEDIVQIDEGWWQGVIKDESGNIVAEGLFPSNYVEVQSGAAGQNEQDAAGPEALRRQQQQEEDERLEAERQQREEQQRRQQAENQEKERMEREAQRRRDTERQQREQHDREERERQEREEQERMEEERRRQEEWEAQQQQEAAAAAAQQQNSGADQGLTAIALYDYTASEDNEMSFQAGDLIQDIIQLDEGWWQGVLLDQSGAIIQAGLFPSNYVELQTGGEQAPNDVGAEVNPNLFTVVTLYDYTAGEDNEISFGEGEILVNVDAVSPEWWSGQNAAGQIGLFPANYVQRQ